ncbi:meiosis 1 arrest protein, partial [Leptodactylus fuscus]
EMRGNLCRLQRCMLELQAVPVEGSGAARSRCFSMAVLDSLQQSRQWMQCGSSGATLHGCFVEVSIVSPMTRHELIHDLDCGLQDADLRTLRRLLLVHMSCEENESSEPETSPDQGTKSSRQALSPSPDQGSHVYDYDSHVTLPDLLSLEIFFKSWLLEHNGEKEKCYLLFPEGTSELRVLCDVTHPVLNPGLLHGMGDEEPALTTHTGHIQAYNVIRAVPSLRVCGSMLYGLPAILSPTACWELDWDQLETNQENFHALCHCLQSQQLSLVASSPRPGSSAAPPVRAHVLVSASGSAALLLRPLAVRELVLLTKVPTLPPSIEDKAMCRVQDALRSLEVDALYNPLEMSSNLYRHLQVTLTQPPRRHVCPGPSRQVTYPSGKARAAIAPLHFIAPGLTKCRRAENDSPSPKRRIVHEKED